jgi:hypothetical protein
MPFSPDRDGYTDANRARASSDAATGPGDDPRAPRKGGAAAQRGPVPDGEVGARLCMDRFLLARRRSSRGDDARVR